jgi:DNA-binding CsgD family transcriptional regulator
MMDTRLDQHCADVLHAKSVKDLLRKMVAFSEDRGFRSISATVITDHSPTLREYQSITNAPADYMPEFEDIGAARVDPVSQHAAVSSTPLVWDQRTYVDGGQAGLWERQAPSGYHSGIVVAFHLPRGRHFLFGPDCDRPACARPHEVKRLVEDVLQFAAHAQAAAFELCCHIDPPDHELPRPTPGELEALRWSMDGMTRWEIGRKMGLSERHVALRLQRAMRKLDCASTYEAVLRAIKLGLIECL